jgi:hypothetical protein
MFKNFSVKETMEEIKKLRSENLRLDKTCVEFLNECTRLQTESSKQRMEISDLKTEIVYLKQRNKELRQKFWYEVFEENLRLAEEIKQYQAVLESVEKFVGRFSNEKR